MQSNTLRSVTLALLMIASVLVPLADVSFEPPEMMEDKVALEAPPVPCLGADACRGTDAGNTYATSIDITSDFDWTGQNETNTYYGTHTATNYYPYDQMQAMISSLSILLRDMELKLLCPGMQQAEQPILMLTLTEFPLDQLLQLSLIHI